MGLAIGVGVLADLIENDPEGADWLRDSIESMNGVLGREGFSQHVEPEKVPPAGFSSIGSFPYSFLHYLRRAYCCVLEGQALRTGELTKDDDSFIFDASAVSEATGASIMTFERWIETAKNAE